MPVAGAPPSPPWSQAQISSWRSPKTRVCWSRWHQERYGSDAHDRLRRLEADLISYEGRATGCAPDGCAGLGKQRAGSAGSIDHLHHAATSRSFAARITCRPTGSPNLLRETDADEIDTDIDYQYLAEGGVGGSECLATKVHELYPETESAMNAHTDDPFGSPWHEASLNGSTAASFQPGSLANSFDEHGGDVDCLQSR